MACYRTGGCGPYEMYSCSECPASKPEYAQRQSTGSQKEVRLIDANRARETAVVDLVVHHIDRQPTIDPENLRPQGEWVKSEDDYCGLSIIKCSLCREEWCFEVDDDVETLNYHYCPNCGAKMKGRNNNAGR